MAEELFASISEDTRAKVKFWLDIAFLQHDIFKGIEMFAKYVNSCRDEEEKEYAELCFQTRLEQLKDDKNNIN